MTPRFAAAVACLLSRSPNLCHGVGESKIAARGRGLRLYSCRSSLFSMIVLHDRGGILVLWSVNDPDWYSCTSVCAREFFRRDSDTRKRANASVCDCTSCTCTIVQPQQESHTPQACVCNLQNAESRRAPCVQPRLCRATAALRGLWLPL